jgi:hypothetical protein
MILNLDIRDRNCLGSVDVKCKCDMKDYSSNLWIFMIFHVAAMISQSQKCWSHKTIVQAPSLMLTIELKKTHFEHIVQSRLNTSCLSGICS